jgi:predicted aspartyl protease
LGPVIAGIVTPNREAQIRLTILSSGGQQQQIEAMVDTGFNLFLTLPSRLIAALSLPFAPAKATLADGTVVSLDCYWVTLLWEGQPRRIVVVAADDRPLIGMSLLYGSRVTLDVVDGGPVTIEPLP